MPETASNSSPPASGRCPSAGTEGQDALVPDARITVPSPPTPWHRPPPQRRHAGLAAEHDSCKVKEKRRADLQSPSSVRVFPARVGVCLRATGQSRRRTGLPRTRGGLSSIRSRTTSRTESSPHAWGSVLVHARRHVHDGVFPARVGVCLARSARSSTPSLAPTRVGVCPATSACLGPTPPLPHTRGGLSKSTRPSRGTQSHPTRVGVCPTCRAEYYVY